MVEHKDFFIFDGKNSKDFNIHVFDADVDRTAPKIVESFEVPGRNGQIIVDENRYEDVEHRYLRAVIFEDADSETDRFRDWLYSHVGYFRLEDTWHPDEFYLAQVSGEFEPEYSINRDLSKFDINFIRRPERFLKSGEEWVDMAPYKEHQSLLKVGLINPTNQIAVPIVRTKGNGTFTVKVGAGVSYTLKVEDLPSTYKNWAYHDMEMEESYTDVPVLGTRSINSYVTLSKLESKSIFYKKKSSNAMRLEPGSIIVYVDGFDAIEIQPRWWKL